MLPTANGMFPRPKFAPPSVPIKAIEACLHLHRVLGIGQRHTVKMVKAAKLLTFGHMIHIPNVFYMSIGEDLYEHLSTSRLRDLLLRIYFWAGFMNFNLVVVAEMYHFVTSLQSAATVPSAIAVGPCMCFSYLADFKQITLNYHKKLMVSHFDEMEAIFPSTLAKQTEYELSRHARIMKRIMYIFSVVCFAYTSTFCFYPIIRATFRLLFMGIPAYERYLCFLTRYPFDAYTNPWVYAGMYLTHMWAAHVAGMAFVAADLLLVASVTQLRMHFDYLVHSLETYKVKEDEGANMKYLHELVQYHAKCLEQSENMNTIFGFSLLLNFLVASISICFIGFQVTTSTTEDIVKYFIFLVASLVQVFLVCYYGDALISSSLRIGDAAYTQIWYGASNPYKKMLVYIIERSQQPASIRPPTFPPISFNTFMKVISMSYQFFALLRTTYSE